MSISLNINAVDVPNREVLLAWHAKAKPAWSLVMDGVGLCEDIKHVSPATNVIHRDYAGFKGDDGLHTKVTPEAWVQDQYRKLGGRFWAYAGNEPGFDNALIAWTLAAVKKAIKLRQPVVIFNLAVGNPQNVDAWKDAHAVLELACKHPEVIAIGLHEYFLGVPTSGFVGGNPDGSVDGEPGRVAHPDFTHDWPEDPLALGMLWHCGRFRKLQEYCQAQGWLPPLIIITEHGADNLRDLENYRKGLPVADGFTEIRGWHSLAKYWSQLRPEWTKERYFFEAMAYLDRTVYKPSGVEAQLIFSWTANEQWRRMFDVSGSGRLLELLAEYNAAPVDDAPPAPPPPPPVVDIPPHLTNPVTGVNRTPYAVRVHTQGSVTSPQTGSIAPKAAYTYYPATSVKNGNHTWVFVEAGDLRGWSALEALGIDNPPPVEPPPDNGEAWAALAARVNALEVERDDLIEKYGKLVNALKAFVSVIDSL